MTLRLVIAFALASPLLASCFNPDLTCLTCLSTCPGSLECHAGFCVSPGATEEEARNVCRGRAFFDARPEAPISVEPPIDGGDGGGDVESPEVLEDPIVCDEKCCVGGQCLQLTPRVRSGLVLWADRVSLPKAGDKVVMWRDRSTHGNHILSQNQGSPPVVQQDEVGRIVEINDPGMVLATKPGPQLRFGVEDFTILVLARCDSRTNLGTLVDRIDGPRDMRTGFGLYCNHRAGGLVGPMLNDPNRIYFRLVHELLLPNFGQGELASANTFNAGELRLYAARRVLSEIQLRVNGKVEARGTIPPSLTLPEESATFVGALATVGVRPSTSFVGGIAAVVIVSGPLEDDELGELESFLMERLGPPPGQRP